MATFGYTTIGGTQTQLASGASFTDAGLFNGGPTSGTLQSISFYTATNTGTISFQVALYGATSQNLIGHSTTQTIGTIPGWVTASVSGTINDSNGNYIIAFDSNTNSQNLQFYFDSPTNGEKQYIVSSSYYNSWPGTSTFVSSGNNEKISIYFTYAPAASSMTGISSISGVNTVTF